MRNAVGLILWCLGYTCMSFAAFRALHIHDYYLFVTICGIYCIGVALMLMKKGTDE